MPGPVVTISRQHGSAGEEVAALVAERLAVPLLDQEIRQRAAARAGVPEQVIDQAEQPMSFVARLLERLGSGGVMPDGAMVETTVPPLLVAPMESFRAVLDQVVREAAAAGAVIVGHAAQLSLRDRPDVLRVLVQAPLEARVARVAQTESVSVAEARRQVETLDRERGRFYHDAYHVNWYDARLYDCVVDTQRLGIRGAAEVVLQLAARVGGARSEPASRQPAPAGAEAAAPSTVPPDLPPVEAVGEVHRIGDEAVRIRPMLGGDGGRLRALFRSLPPAELLFLRRNVTDPRVIEAWEREVTDGTILTLLAERLTAGRPAAVIGEASLRRSDVPWTRHVGDVRAVVAPAHRRRGLGSALLREILRAAADADIDKLTTETLAEQRSAREVLGRLGFTQEGYYVGYARDLSGQPHDVVVMTYTRPPRPGAVPGADDDAAGGPAPAP